MEKEIEYIALNRIHPHPQNPRKDLGDLTELVDSVRKNGIMQNLTLVPMEGREGEYLCLIGHRRCAAAKKAGLEEAPAVVKEDLSINEQVGIMLEENMQRADLTVIEQAQGFQMMLDLGDSVEDITRKTGFSETTVYHRLNIAKLDQDVLKDCMDGEAGFQLSITDLIALEQLKDVEDRNEVLSEACSSADLKGRIERRARENREKERQKKIVADLEAMGIRAANKSVEREQWTQKWETVAEYDLNDEVPKEYQIKGLKDGKIAGKDAFWVRYQYRCWISVIVKAPEKKQTKADRERQEREAKIKEIKEILKNQAKNRSGFIESLLEGKMDPVKDDVETIRTMWRTLLEMDVCINNWELYDVIDEAWRQDEEVETKAKERIKETPVTVQMLFFIVDDVETTSTVDWQGRYLPEYAEKIRRVDEFLESYGMPLDDKTYLEIRDGSSALYEKGE